MIVENKGGKLEPRLEQEITSHILSIFKSQAPKRTFALQDQIRLEFIPGGIRIISDIYYMPYTEEKWISPQWRGRANPNEGWFRQANDIALGFLTRQYGKEFKRES